jgi:hypothetical protein
MLVHDLKFELCCTLVMLLLQVQTELGSPCGEGNMSPLHARDRSGCGRARWRQVAGRRNLRTEGKARNRTSTPKVSDTNDKKHTTKVNSTQAVWQQSQTLRETYCAED